MPSPLPTEIDDPLNVNVEDFSEESLQAQQLLLAATHNDIENIRILLRSGVPASTRDEETAWTALHAAIASLAPDDESLEGVTNDSQEVDPDQLARTEKTVKLLLDNGAVWSDVDSNDETPGCLALRLGLRSLYEMMVDAGVRAELLRGRLDGYERLADEEFSDSITDGTETLVEDTTRLSLQSGPIDSNTTGIQPSQTWERSLKQQIVTTLISKSFSAPESSTTDNVPSGPYRILSITHFSDEMNLILLDHLTPQLTQSKPTELHLVNPTGQPRPSQNQDNDIVPSSNNSNINIRIHTYQTDLSTTLSMLIDQNLTFDAIYYDPRLRQSETTLPQSNTQNGNTHFGTSLHTLVSTYLSDLLALGTGYFTFFHSLGIERKVYYDVYTTVLEIDFLDYGFEVEFTSHPIPPDIQGEDDQSQRVVDHRRVTQYRLPIVRAE